MTNCSFNNIILRPDTILSSFISEVQVILLYISYFKKEEQPYVGGENKRIRVSFCPLVALIQAVSEGIDRD